jgi:muramoyltetrapeptide carboxypeptidase
VYVVAPSSPFEAEPVRRGLDWLRERYRVHTAPDLFERRAGFLAGSDQQRRAELQEALSAPDVAAVVTARGGYGLTRLLADLDWSAFERAPRWIVGFSDTTALHCEALRRGVVSLHAHHVSGLGRVDAPARLRWVEALEQPLAEIAWENLEVWCPGEAAGDLFGGNLTLLFTLAASGQLHVPRGAVLFLEDVTETSYRIDRMLTALHAGGHLARAGAVVLGGFTDCSAGKYDVPVAEVLRERLVPLGVPVLAGLPVGHGDRNDPLPLGRFARVQAGDPGGVLRVPGAAR